MGDAQQTKDGVEERRRDVGEEDDKEAPVKGKTVLLSNFSAENE